MTVRVYRSSDVGAPVLNAVVGSLITVLDACLVNGYGSKAGSGWIKAYNDVSGIAAYQMQSGSLRFMRIQDNGSSGNGTARVIGYEAMSGVSTGTNPFPTDVQQPSGAVIFKSPNALGNASACAWILVATQTMMYLWTNIYNEYVPTTYAQIASFGDITSYTSGDLYGTMICAQITSTITSVQSNFNRLGSTLTTASAGNWLSRSYTKAVGAVTAMKFTDTIKNGMLTVPSGQQPMPEPINQTMNMAPMWVAENLAVGAIRGLMPGVWIMLNLPVFNMISQTQGPSIAFTTGPLTGKTVELISSGVGGSVWIETSNTW